MEEVTIWHNARCSKSRATLTLLEERGHQPRIVPYLEEPPGEAELKRVLDLLGSSPATPDEELVRPFPRCPPWAKLSATYMLNAREGGNTASRSPGRTTASRSALLWLSISIRA